MSVPNRDLRIKGLHDEITTLRGQISLTFGPGAELEQRLARLERDMHALDYKIEQQPDPRLEFYSKHLELTLTHTQFISKLMYVLQGAVLAFGAYVFQTFGSAKFVLKLSVFVLIVLTLLNLVHMLIVVRERAWFKRQSEAWRVLVNAESLEANVRGFSSRLMFAVIQGLIAVGLAFAAHYAWRQSNPSAADLKRPEVGRFALHTHEGRLTVFDTTTGDIVHRVQSVPSGAGNPQTSDVPGAAKAVPASTLHGQPVTQKR